MTAFKTIVFGVLQCHQDVLNMSFSLVYPGWFLNLWIGVFPGNLQSLNLQIFLLIFFSFLYESFIRYKLDFITLFFMSFNLFRILFLYFSVTFLLISSYLSSISLILSLAVKLIHHVFKFSYILISRSSFLLISKWICSFKKKFNSFLNLYLIRGRLEDFPGLIWPSVVSVGSYSVCIVSVCTLFLPSSQSLSFLSIYFYYEFMFTAIFVVLFFFWGLHWRWGHSLLLCPWEYILYRTILN